MVSPYDLQRRAGISLGASIPALRRLLTDGLVSRTEETSERNRPRHEYRPTLEGLEAAQTGWKPYLEKGELPNDLDSVLRVADMAAHYGAEKRKIRAFLKRAAEERHTLAQQAGLAAPKPSSHRVDLLSYSAMRLRCDADRLQAEATALHAIAALFVDSKKFNASVQRALL